MSEPSTPESDAPPSSTRPAEYVADIGFDDLPMSEPLRRAVTERGYVHPTPVQAQAFRPVLEGKDLIVRSKTGTGKTAAFGLPLLEKMESGERRVRALVLCPTRELAMQVASEISELGKHKDIKVTAIYGGASMKAQEDALDFGSAFVVGTPGRVADHIRRGNLKLETCTHVVLDEADEMLNQGFYEDVTGILDQLPKDRQVLLFSATLPPDIQRLIAQYTTNAQPLLLSGDVLTVEHIQHVRYDVSDAFPKPRNLIYVLEMEQPENAIIFCNTRDDTELVTAVLNRNGFDTELLNGDLPQKERERVMAKIKRGEVSFMVATDIAARGIDISDLGHVINYSLPEDPAVYLHRVGRTGRIGKKGVAINLVTGRELTTFTTLERKYNIQFEKREMPSPAEAERIWAERHVREIREVLPGAIYEGFLPLAAQLKGRPDGDDLMAFLLKYFFTRHRMEKLEQARASDSTRNEGSKSRESSSTAGSGSSKKRGRGREKERGGRTARSSEGADTPTSTSDESGRQGPARERRRRDDRKRGVKVPPLVPGPGQVRLWMNLGDAEPLDEAGVRALLEAAGAPTAQIAAMSVQPTHTYALVPEEAVAGFETLNNKEHDGRKLRVERARPLQPARGPAQSAEDPSGVRLWMNIGKADTLDETTLVQSLEAQGAPSGKIAKLQIRQTYAYAFVAEDDVAAFEALNGKMLGEKALKVERSRRR